MAARTESTSRAAATSRRGWRSLLPPWRVSGAGPHGGRTLENTSVSEAMRMTQQFLAGELSVLLAQLLVVATSQESYQAAARLRHLAETVPVADLASVVPGALDLVDDVCWDSLER